MNRNALKLRNKFYPPALQIAITGNPVGAVGSPRSVVLSTNRPASIGIVSGDNAVIEDAPDDQDKALSLIDVSAPGTFRTLVEAVDDGGARVRAAIEFELTGSPELPALTGLTATAAGPNLIEVDWDTPDGVDGVDISVNEQDDNPVAFGTEGPGQIGLLTPETEYDFKGRTRVNGPPAEYGAWSSIVTEMTDPYEPPVQEGTQADMADLFAQSFIVQLHLNIADSSRPDSYYDSWKPYFQECFDAGMRYARTAMGNAYSRTRALQMRDDFPGVQFCVPLNVADPVARITTLRNNVGASAFIGFEGWNEYDHGHETNSQLVVDLINFGALIWNKVRSHSDLNHVTVIDSSPWGRRPSSTTMHLDLGYNENHYDALNLHYYTGGRQPTIAGAPAGVDENGDEASEVGLATYTIPDLMRRARERTDMPIWITETGWNQKTPLSAFYVTEEAQAIYSMVMQLEGYLLGCPKIVPFEFLNNVASQNKEYGWLKWSSGAPSGPYTKRTIFDALVRLCSLFNDQGEDFEPGTLNYGISGAGFDGFIHHKLFQRRDGIFLLAIWRDVQVYKRTPTYGNIDVGTKAVTVDFGETVANVRTFRPYVNSSATDVDTNVSSANLSIPGDPMIVEITPAA